jgi:hypothetical protein
MAHYFGMKSDLMSGVRYYSSVAVSSNKGFFSPKSDKDSPESEEVPAVKAQSSDQSVFSVATSFFDSMLGFTGVLQRAGIAYHLIQNIELDAMKEKEVVPAAISTEKIGDWEVFEIREEGITRVNRKAKTVVRQIEHIHVLDSVFLMGLVSQFDAYVGRLIRTLAIAKPHIVFESEKKYTATEVLEFSRIEDFKEAVLEKEIEGVLRESHEKQFAWMETKFGKPLRAGLDVWPAFIELCERRNLIAHAAGHVSKTYLEKCHAVGFKTSAKLGDLLRADPDYLPKSAWVLLEIGVKLSQVLARVAFDSAECHELADRTINDFAYELIHSSNYPLAISLLEFALTKPMKHPKKPLLYMIKINLANAYKLAGNLEKAKHALEDEDWTATRIDFQVCAAAVLDDLEKVRQLAPMVPPDYIAPQDFLVWPVFAGLSKTKEYIDFVRQTFGEAVVDINWKSKIDGDSDSHKAGNAETKTTRRRRTAVNATQVLA